ncbi:MAG: hypothetical protein J1F18_12095, partial [Lachnospiraceae bacterium]|nr:hypothetical protein [Lachnospiraceae bacterium]
KDGEWAFGHGFDSRLVHFQLQITGECYTKMSGSDLVVGGYRFGTIADAETARMEEKKIAAVEKHLDYRKPQNVLLVYNKAIDNKIFLTPVGMAYLQRIQEQLIKCGIQEEKIKPIPLYATFSNKTENNSSIRRSMASRAPKVEFKGRFMTSLCINVLLVLALTAMIILSLHTDVPNIINYRTAIVNEYSEWEQQLQEREQAVRQAERNLE